MALMLNEYAHICSKVYQVSEIGGGDTLVPGFECARMVTDPVEGFKGAIYIRGGDCVVAFKGTETEKGMRQGLMDVAADIRLAVGQLPKQVTPATQLLAFAQAKFGTKTISICGHSLGGGLAQVVGYQAKVPFVTFNAPPMATNVDESWAKTARRLVWYMPGGSLAFPVFSQIAQSIARGKHLGESWGINLRMSSDIVSAAFWGGDHVGRVITIDTPLGAGEAHTMAAVRKAIFTNIGMKVVTVSGQSDSRKAA